MEYLFKISRHYKFILYAILRFKISHNSSICYKKAIIEISRCVSAAFGTSSDDQTASGTSAFAAIGPLLLVALAVCVIAVVAVSIRSLRRPPTKPTDINDNASTTIDVSLLAPPSLALDLDDDNVLDFAEEEEENAEEKEEVKTRRIGNLAQVMKNGRYFRVSFQEQTSLTF